MLELLRNRRFRLLWTSSFFADLSMVMWVMVHGWLALEVTGSPFWVGATAGAEGVGLAIVGVFGGVLVDRVPRRNILLATNAIQVGMALGLSFLVVTDTIEISHILAFAVLDGALMSIKQPSRMALTLDVVGRPMLLKATAVNFTSMTSTGIVGPIIAGIVVRRLDIEWAYIAIAAAYVVALVVIALLRAARPPRAERSSPWSDLKAGVRYVTTAPAVRLLIGIALVTEIFGWSHEAMLPVIARDLNVGVSGLGYLIAVGSAGAMVSTLVISASPEARRKGRLMVIALVGFGSFLVLFAISPWFPLSMLLLAAGYAAVMLFESTLSTLLQTVVPNEMRGRVLSFQTVAWGLTGIAGFYTGAIAAATSAQVSIALGGGVLVVVALLASRKLLRLRVEPADPGGG